MDNQPGSPFVGVVGICSLSLLGALLSPPVSAGTWGQENWGAMYWGNNPVSAPVAAPIIESIVADGANLIITISDYAPGQDGWSGITGYTVTCGDVGSLQTSESPVIIEGLEGDTDYECSVIATNAEGNSPAAIQLATTDSVLGGLNITIIYSALCRSANPPNSCP